MLIQLHLIRGAVLVLKPVSFCTCLLLLTIVICQQRELLLPNNAAFLIRGTNADKTFLNISERSLERNLIAGIFSP